MRRLPTWAGCISLLCTVTIIPLAAHADDPDMSIGQIKTASGTVTLHHAGQATAAKAGDHLCQADMIETAANSAVGITFADNSRMSLGPNSQLALDQFRFDTTTHDGVFNSTLKKGTLVVSSGQIVQQTPLAMHIQTPAALLGVRGTKFLVRAEGGTP